MMEDLQRENSVDEVSLKEIILRVRFCFKYLLLKWFIILPAILIGAIAGYLSSSKKKITYTAVCTFVVEGGQTAQPTGLAALLSGSAGGGDEGLFRGGTLLSLYTTRLMLEKTLFSTVDSNGKKIQLIDWYLLINEQDKKWAEIPSSEKSALLAGIIAKLANEYVSVQSGSFVIVKVKSPDELFSKVFAEKLIETVNNFYVQTKTQKSLTNLRILQKQVDSLRLIMTQKMAGAAVAADANPNPNPALRVLSVPAQRRSVDAQATTSLYSGLVTSLETAKMEIRKETPLIQIIDRPILPLNKEAPDVKKGIIVGSMLAGILTIILLLLHLFYKKLMF